MRTAFINQLTIDAKKNKKIFLLVADLGFSVIENFAKLYPDRYLNVGIAEQNMAGIAAGLAKEGFCVYIYSIGNFPTLRCMEQIRYDICYHDLNVNIVAVGGGYSYASLGPSHHATEELGMLRTIPNLIVCAPGDPFEAKELTSLSSKINKPFYIRLGRAGEKKIHTNPINDLELGDNLCLINSKTKNAIFSTGGMLTDSFEFASKFNISLYSFPFIKPLNKWELLVLFKLYEKIIIIEEHQISAGFGSAILENLNDLVEDHNIDKNDIPKIKRVAIKDEFYSLAGSQKYLKNIAGLNFNDANNFFNLD
jgi:transketolase|tara:strand:+ start:403 stop:1329 length:927 start_codon:yes stop_codon:yes gene_type:complete